ncbi:MAG: choice-of-anchor L domain-containing protein, partial [Winogradskyella arenosi]
MKKTLLFFTLLFSIFSFSQDINMEPGVFMRCGPDMFYDSGSQFGGYGNDENIVTTICPLTSDQFTILKFNFFFTEGGSNPDVMNIYDGDDTTAPLLGTYSGPVGAFTVSASGANTSGCLTVEFISNSTQSVDGWEAEILCATACQDIDASFDSSSPEPNAAGVIGILPGDTVDFSGSALFQSDDTGATYNWDFGDGESATGTDVSHTFLSSGTYTVTFTATDSNPQGCFDSDTVTVFVLGPNLVVDQDMFTVEELIEDVLVDSPCASVSNIIYSTGSTIDPTLPNGIGYFFSDGVNFEFEDGIVLTSGDASRAGGPNTSTLSDGSWAGDPDVDALLDPGDTSNDATFIQFNFTPRGNEITFDFLMASEEYNGQSFECDYSDAFAFLLTDSAGNETNLAVIPGTTTPILVTNIHPDNGYGCGAPNVRYFDSYTPSNGAPISFDGYTVPFTAFANVIPNEEYTIKMVIADARDSIYDSGVFIRAGSFNLGGDLGEDITIAAGNAQCDGSEVILDTEIALANHVWYKDGVVIPGETTSLLTVTEPGTYYAEFDIESVCSGSSDPIVIEFRDNPSANEAPDLVVCSETGSEEFDLTQNDDDVLGTQAATDYTVTYHLTEQDAIDNVGALVSPYTNVSNPQVIWARLADVTQTCSDVTSFTISAALAPTINAASNLELCDDDSNDGIGEFTLSDQTAIILGAQSATDFEVSYHLDATDAELGNNALPLTYTNTVNSQPIYVRVTSLADTSCYSFSAAPLFNLVVNTRALATMPANMEICDDASGDGVAIFDLASQEAAILNGQNPAVYNVSFYASLADAQSGTGALPSTYENTSSPNQQTLYARVEDPAFLSCYGTTSFDIIVNALPVLTAPTALEVCDDGTPDGLTEMDLSIKNAEITGGNPSYVVSYHETLPEAELGDNPLPTLYTNT